jgi:hypothetical protein
MSSSLQLEVLANPNMRLSHPKVSQLLVTCDAAIWTLVGLMDDALHICESRRNHNDLPSYEASIVVHR